MLPGCDWPGSLLAPVLTRPPALDEAKEGSRCRGRRHSRSAPQHSRHRRLCGRLSGAAWGVLSVGL